jgi:hypothetical protein
MTLESSGVDFTNLLPAAFTRTDPKSTKSTDGFTIFCGFEICACKKAAHKTLMKLNPEVAYNSEGVTEPFFEVIPCYFIRLLSIRKNSIFFP